MKRTLTIPVAGALSLALLGGCASPAPEATPAPNDIVYQTAALRREEPLFTVDGAEVSAETYLFWLANSIGTMQQYGMLTDDASWDQTYGDQGTLADAAKADALETAKLYQVIINKANELGVTMTQEQQADMDQQIAAAMESAGGEEKYREQLDGMCITPEAFNALNEVYYLNEGIREKLEQEGELSATDQEVEQFITDNDIYGAKHILIATRRAKEDGTGYEDFSDEEKAQALQKAQDIRDQIAQAGDSEEKFDELMEQWSEDGRDEDGKLYAPDGYAYVMPGEMVPEFEEGVLALKEGEVGGPVQSDFGYHIILRIPVDREQARAECEGDAKLNQLTQQWVDEAQVETTEAYDALDPKDFYGKLNAILTARADAESILSSAQPEESPSETAPAE